MEINGDLQTVSMQMQYGAGTSKMASEVSTSKSSDETSASKTSDLAAYSKTKSMANTKYTAVSKDGDTLELSSSAINSSSSDTISDTELATYTESKLRQLLSSNQITRQQYEKAISGK